MRSARTSYGIASVIVGVLFFAGVWRSAAVAQESGAVSAAQGVITGTILDASTAEPIIEAGVEVVETHKRVRTDLDGKYKITIAPGTYELRIFAPLYTGARLQKVTVRANRTTTADAALKPEGEAGVEVVEVVAQADKAAEAIQLLERQKAAVVSDNVSAETIKKSTDSDAAEIVERVPAVTVEEGGFVIVRGLGDRYSSALLDGNRLPSTDPNKRVVPLDLFPSDFLESLSIMKTYTPDLPGDFSGGLVDIRLREFPDRLTYTLGVQGGGNTASTFQSFNTYNGGTLDYFTFGSKFRQLPDAIPDFNITSSTFAKQRFYANSLKDVWSIHSVTAPPNFGLNFNVGNTWGPFGASLGGLYTTEYKEHRVEVDRTLVPPGLTPDSPAEIKLADNFLYNRADFDSRLGGVFTAGYNISPLHRIGFRGFVNRQSEDETLLGSGTTDLTPDVTTIQSRLQYTEDQLGFGQLSSEHHLGAMDIETRTALSETTEDVPDSRILQYQDVPPPEFFPDSQSGLRTWLNLEEHLSDSAVDFTVPFRTRLPFTDVWSGLPAQLKFGPAYTYRKRTLEFRRFRYVPNGTLPPSLRSLPGEQLFALDNIGGPGQGAFQFVEETRVSDSFDASQEIAAIYGMVDLPIVADRLRFVGGVRTEYSYITLDSARFETQAIHARINDLDPLPGVNLIYTPRDDMNLRYAYSMTVSRPEFRELTPTIFPNPAGLSENIIGNPNLISASIQSHDLRWEWFFSPNELASISFFYKELSDPIEAIGIPQSSGEATSFENAKDGQLLGVEVEGRKDFGFLSPMLAGVSLAANAAYIDSTVHIIPTKLFNTTNTSRAMVGQSPYVFNAALEYANARYGTARLLYNTAGRKIIRAGVDGLDDVYEESRNELDFTYLVQIAPYGVPINAKIAIENITDDRTLQTQNAFVRVRYTEGVKFTFGLSYTY